MMDVRSVQDAYTLLETLGAPVRLISHLKLVSEAAAELTSEFDGLGVAYDKNYVIVGAALHDAGKILHPEELDLPGALHENAGEQLLLQNGVAPELARCCRSHSQYDQIPVCLEELIIALADKLWKGSRKPDLELRVIDDIAIRLSVDRWDIFEQLDSCFERIAMDGQARLMRSKVPVGE